jgi:hypothetical protein
MMLLRIPTSQANVYPDTVRSVEAVVQLLSNDSTNWITTEIFCERPDPTRTQHTNCIERQQYS